MKTQWLYARDYPNRKDLWTLVEELEKADTHVIVDDNWNIIYHSGQFNKLGTYQEKVIKETNHGKEINT